MSTLQSSSPSPRKKSMHATDPSHVVVRLQQSRGLEDALRVHVLPESLETTGLSVGEPCEIISEDGSVAYGIAWRAEDRLNTSRPKLRPAKMTEILRDLFDIKEGSKVAISKTELRTHPADKIYLSDVTPAGHNKASAIDETSWKSVLAALFTTADALAAGITFDILGKKKFRRRFHIDNIESSSAPVDAFLFTANDETQLALTIDANVTNTSLPNASTHRENAASNVNGSSTISHEMSSLALRTELSTERIGGLLEETRELNEHMQFLLDEARWLNRQRNFDLNPAVILHGYEGCGKTLLLEALSECDFRKVVQLDRQSLTGGSISKNQELIRERFKEARAAQPSLVVMDNLEQLVPIDDVAYSGVLAKELESIRENRVMVVGATRLLTDIHASLLRLGKFSDDLELPIPDRLAREHIIKVLMGKVTLENEHFPANIAARTHGFTGNDLSRLYAVIQNSVGRRQRRRDTREPVRPSSLPAYSETDDVTQKVAVASSLDITDADVERALTKVKPTALREIFTETPKVNWSDIGGCEEIKERFDEIIGMPLLHPDVLEMFGSQPQKGVLLYGPPGCSKTLTAQAVANSYNLNFIAIKGAELISMYVGESEKAIREVFRKARTAAPCVIFFDEIDSIGASRKAGGGTSGLNVLTTLLNEMDGFETLRNVIVLAATNTPESLDPALMRPGRFDSHVYLGPPNELARREILSISTRCTPLAEDVHFEALVEETDGYSGAEIVSLVEEARKPAMKRQCLKKDVAHRVTAHDFQTAKSVVKKGITSEMLAGYEAFRNRV